MCCNETKESRRPAAARRPGAGPGGPGDACSPASTPPTFVAIYLTHHLLQYELYNINFSSYTYFTEFILETAYIIPPIILII